jgi:ubiquinone/menaquinone biosynthesis C-methylase UbiE
MPELHNIDGLRGKKMSAVRNATEEYVLGNSIHEQERLKMQAKFLQQWSKQFFLSAGLEPGMHVLDLGRGMGDVSFCGQARWAVGPRDRN